MNKTRDFLHITPCGECCLGCVKKATGQCRGCLESDGHCEEWAGSGVCPTYACAKEHGVPFCGVCPEFPCDHLPMMKWRPDCIRELTELAEAYRAWQALPRLYCLTLGYDTDKRWENFHVGLFATREEAQTVSARYRREVPGFCRAEVTEVVSEIPLQGAKAIPSHVYRWQGWNVDDDLEEYDLIGGDCYADESAAQTSLALAQRDTPRQAWVLNRHVVGQCDWQEGFESYTY